MFKELNPIIKGQLFNLQKRNISTKLNRKLSWFQ